MKSVLHVFTWPELEAELEAELGSEHEVASQLRGLQRRYVGPYVSGYSKASASL